MTVKKKGTTRTKPAKRRTKGVGLERGARQTGGLTHAAEKIGAALGATVGMMDSAVHSAAAFGAREMATAAHEVELIAKKFHTPAPLRRRTRSSH